MKIYDFRTPQGRSVGPRLAWLQSAYFERGSVKGKLPGQADPPKIGKQDTESP